MEVELIQTDLLGEGKGVSESADDLIEEKGIFIQSNGDAIDSNDVRCFGTLTRGLDHRYMEC